MTDQPTTPAPGSGLGAGEGLPTKAMINAGVAHALTVTIGRNYIWPDYIRDLWLRMQSFAPTPSTQAGDAGLRDLVEAAIVDWSRSLPAGKRGVHWQASAADLAHLRGGIVAALAQSRPEPDTAQGWRAIGEAPRDGTIIWLGAPGQMCIGRWDAEEDELPGWETWGRQFVKGAVLGVQPTVWRPYLVPEFPPLLAPESAS